MADLKDKSHQELIAEIERLRTQVATEHEKNATVVFDNLFQFSGLVDLEGKYVEVNPTSLKMGHVTLSEVRGQYIWANKWSKTLSDEQILELKKNFILARDEQRFIRYEVGVFAPGYMDGKLYIDFSLTPVTDESGKVICFVTEGRDITERKRAEDEIKRKNEELQELYSKIRDLDHQKSIFLANISHELKTPLALMLGPAEKVLRQDPLIPTEVRSAMECIISNGNILLKHVNDLLDLSRLEAKKAYCDYIELRDFMYYIKRLSSNFEVLAADRHIEFNVTERETFKIQCDIDKLEKVYLNLLSNAFKFTPDGGKVIVTVNYKEPSPDDPRGTVQIIVQDSGPGIPEAQRSKIFERFQQGDEGSARKYGGTGLGLAIAKDFTELHGGKIVVQDSPLGGAEFVVEIPALAPSDIKVTRDDSSMAHSTLGLQTVLDVKSQLPVLDRLLEQHDFSSSGTSTPEVSNESSDVSSRGPVSPEHKGVVLVVEDNIAMNKFIQESLEEEFIVLTALNGKEALKIMEKYTPDCILTDIMMPLMSGDALVEAVRSNPRLDKIPIILLTAKADDELKVHLLRNGAQDYISKPFHAEDVKARVSNMISIKKAWEALNSTIKTQAKSLSELIEDIKILFSHDASCK